MKIASTSNAAIKTCQKSTYGTQPSAWLMMGVQCMMALSTGTRGLSATPEPTKGLAGHGLGLENSMIVRTQVKHRLQRRSCFYAAQRLLERLAYCLQNEPSSSTLGRELLDNSLSLDNSPLFTTKPSLGPQERRALWRNWAESQLEGRPEAALGSGGLGTTGGIC